MSDAENAEIRELVLAVQALNRTWTIDGLCWLLRASALSSRPPVLVMESAERWNGNDRSTTGRVCSARWNRYALLEPLVRAAPIEMGDPFIEHGHQVRFAQDDDVIQTLTSRAPDEALVGRVHQWRPDCRPSGCPASGARLASLGDRLREPPAS